MGESKEQNKVSQTEKEDMDKLTEFHDEFERQNQGFKKISIYWALRTMLSPVIESLILVDRLIYIEEQQQELFGSGDVGVNLMLFPLFNPILSPRNFVLVATNAIQKK